MMTRNQLERDALRDEVSLAHEEMNHARIEIAARVENVEGPFEDGAHGLGRTVDSRDCALSDELDELDTAM